jgi:hypothetical protein
MVHFLYHLTNVFTNCSKNIDQLVFKLLEVTLVLVRKSLKFLLLRNQVPIVGQSMVLYEIYREDGGNGITFVHMLYTNIQCLLSGIWKKDNHSNEVIFQIEITSKKFHQRESFHLERSFHQERSLNTVPIVHWLPNNRNLISQQ